MRRDTVIGCSGIVGSTKVWDLMCGFFSEILWRRDGLEVY